MLEATRSAGDAAANISSNLPGRKSVVKIFPIPQTPYLEPLFA
jgi:hypothetical protein